jgi:hypothetical protein
MSKLKPSDLTVGQHVAYKQGHKSSTVTVLEIKNRIKVNDQGQERWVTVSSLRNLDGAKANEAKAVLPPDPMKKDAPPPEAAVAKSPQPKRARTAKAKPVAAVTVTSPEPIAVSSFMQLSPRVMVVLVLILLMLMVGVYLYLNRAQLANLTITPTVMP